MSTTRKYRNILTGAGSIISVFPTASLKRTSTSYRYYRLDDTKAAEVDWKAVGDDVKTAMTIMRVRSEKAQPETK